MSDRLELLARRLRQLDRMREYLAYSFEQMQLLLPIENWAALSAENHETLAAFRVRFSEEKLAIIDAASAWKELRELRNAINHEYEENPHRLAAFFKEVAEGVPSLMDWHQRLSAFCKKNYGI